MFSVIIGVDIPGVEIVVSLMPVFKFQTSQVYIPLVLFIVVSVWTDKGLHPVESDIVKSAIGSSIV